MGKEVRVSPGRHHARRSHRGDSNQLRRVPARSLLERIQPRLLPQVSVGVKEEKARNVVLKEGATVEELVRALSSIGSTPRDIIAILQSLRAAGALESEIQVI